MKELWQSTDVGGNKNSSNEGRKHLNGEEKYANEQTTEHNFFPGLAQ